ncbi:MAG: dihydroxyacetone kinase subunit DhaL [Eubacteriales bacterium]
MKHIDNKELNVIFQVLKDIMNENRDYLIKLDSAIGDGDLGITMSKGFDKAAEISSNLEEKDLGKYLIKIGMGIAEAVPSTMGTLVATGFMNAGKELKGNEVLCTKKVAILFEAFVNGIMNRSKAKPGEKTVIDSLYKASEALKNSIELPLKEAIKIALVEAEKGLEATKQMKSTYGKAAIYQEKSIGKLDPGATVGKLIVEGFYKAIVTE